MLEAGRLLRTPQPGEVAARPRLAEDEQPLRLPRYSAARREAWLSWMSSKNWPTVDDMQRHFDRYDDLLRAFGAQIARGECVEPFDLIRDSSDDSLQHFRRHYSSWTAGGAPAPRHDHLDTRATRAAKMQQEWEEVWAKRRAEQRAESDRQWNEAIAEKRRERRRALRVNIQLLYADGAELRVEVIRPERAAEVLLDRAINAIASVHPFSHCLMCDQECGSEPLKSALVLITANVASPTKAVVQRLCDDCAGNRANLAGRIAAKLSLCLRMVAA